MFCTTVTFLFLVQMIPQIVNCESHENYSTEEVINTMKNDVYIDVFPYLNFYDLGRNFYASYRQYFCLNVDLITSEPYGYFFRLIITFFTGIVTILVVSILNDARYSKVIILTSTFMFILSLLVAFDYFITFNCVNLHN